jgi:hypothetical protein
MAAGAIHDAGTDQPPLTRGRVLTQARAILEASTHPCIETGAVHPSHPRVPTYSRVLPGPRMHEGRATGTGLVHQT